MKIIEIAALDNGAHKNQDFHGVLPDGWAFVPVDEKTLENFPFGAFDVEDRDGKPYMIAESWVPGVMPEPETLEEPEAEPAPTLEQRVETLEEGNAEMTEALDMILSGVTE